MAFLGGLLILISLLTIPAAIVGMISPSRLAKKGEEPPSRKKILLSMTVAFFVFMGIGGALLPSQNKEKTEVVAEAPKAEKPKVENDKKNNDAKTIKALFDQVSAVDKNLRARNKEMLAIASKAAKLKSQTQKKKLADELNEKLNNIALTLATLDKVEVPEIENVEAKKRITEAIALQKEWANNHRASYVAAMQGNASAITIFQNEADAQSIKIVLLYAQAAEAVGLVSLTDK